MKSEPAPPQWWATFMDIVLHGDTSGAHRGHIGITRNVTTTYQAPPTVAASEGEHPFKTGDLLPENFGPLELWEPLNCDIPFIPIPFPSAGPGCAQTWNRCFRPPAFHLALLNKLLGFSSFLATLLLPTHATLIQVLTLPLLLYSWVVTLDQSWLPCPWIEA